MGAYKAPPILNPLRRHKFVKEGCFLLELELPLTFGHATENPAVDDIDSYSVVVEAKSQSSDEKAAVDQLVSRRGKGGYLQWGHFDEGYITGPDFDGKEHKYGTISNKPDGQLLLVPYRRNRTCSIPETKERTLRQLEQIVKQALIKNIPIQRLLGFCTDKTLNEIGFRGFLNELSLALERMTVDEVCSFVREKD